jgi:hypothetical protein
MDNRLIHFVLFEWVVDFVLLFQCMFGVGEG